MDSLAAEVEANPWQAPWGRDVTKSVARRRAAGDVALVGNEVRRSALDDWVVSRLDAARGADPSARRQNRKNRLVRSAKLFRLVASVRASARDSERWGRAGAGVDVPALLRVKLGRARGRPRERHVTTAEWVARTARKYGVAEVPPALLASLLAPPPCDADFAVSFCLANLARSPKRVGELVEENAFLDAVLVTECGRCPLSLTGLFRQWQGFGVGRQRLHDDDRWAVGCTDGEREELLRRVDDSSAGGTGVFVAPQSGPLSHLPLLSCVSPSPSYPGCQHPSVLEAP